MTLGYPGECGGKTARPCPHGCGFLVCDACAGACEGCGRSALPEAAEPLPARLGGAVRDLRGGRPRGPNL